MNGFRISPRVDFAFKLIFEQNTDLLIGLINAVVDPHDRVESLIIKNPYSGKERSADKLTILDIKAKNESGKWFNIEAQVTDEIPYDKRSLYYWSRVYSGQLERGDYYHKLNKTIGIHLLNFNLFDYKSYHNTFRIKHDKTNEPFSDLLELHYIELKKVPEQYSELKTSLDRWGAFLARSETYEAKNLPAPLCQDPLIRKAMKVLETTQLDEEEWHAYEGRLKWLMDEASIFYNVETRGVRKEKERTVLRLHKEGWGTELIARVTDLDHGSIESVLSGQSKKIPSR